jgi:hypothetical protein
MGSYLPEKKIRDFTSIAGTYQSRTSGGAPWGADKLFYSSLTEDIISQCHTGVWPPPLSSDTDVGGPMALHRVSDQHIETATISAAFTRGTIGLSQVSGYTLGLSPAIAGSGSVMNAFGTSSIARVLPTNPNASLATAVGELRRDGLPTLPGSSLKDSTTNARRAGGEYLNVEFGWLPLVSDLQDFARSVRNSRQLIDQYVRDSDRKIRRRYTPQGVSSTSIFTGTGRWFGQNIAESGTTVSRKEDTNLWFSGAFKYHVPIDDGFYGRLLRYEALANHLFGTRITPELVWNLAPWSWAVDWFTNAGDVIHNISLMGVDGLVMQYGYAMRYHRVSEHVSGGFSFVDGFGTHSGHSQRLVVSEWKQRVRANPYGFGIDDVDLSNRQLAILAALGLSRGKRTSQ